MKSKKWKAKFWSTVMGKKYKDLCYYINRDCEFLFENEMTNWVFG